MKLRLDLVFPAILVATAGSELVPADVMPEHADRTCQIDQRSDGSDRREVEQRILADGYTEIAALAKGCDGAWHALALADGDPVNVLATSQGAVITE